MITEVAPGALQLLGIERTLQRTYLGARDLTQPAYFDTSIKLENILYDSKTAGTPT